tara:strand:- start:199 stop:639 length:441 start_codon:yes stop_codon:yes gene_type:complete
MGYNMYQSYVISEIVNGVTLYKSGHSTQAYNYFWGNKRIKDFNNMWDYKLNKLVCLVACETLDIAKEIEKCVRFANETVVRKQDVEETIYTTKGIIKNHFDGWVRNGSKEWFILKENGDLNTEEKIRGYMKHYSKSVIMEDKKFVA